VVYEIKQKLIVYFFSFDFLGMIYFILACIVYGMSIPSGLFVPGIISGALYGRLSGTFFMSYVYPFQFKHASLGTYALIGAASMLGGITRLSIAVTVILVECTGDIQLTVPLMVAVLFARWSANFFNNGLYDIHIELKGLPFLPYTPPKQTSTLRVFSLMTKNPIVFRPIERVGKILDVLQMTEHNGFPICVPVAKNGRGSDNNVSMMRRRRKQRTNEYGGDEGRSNGGIKTENDILGRRLHGLMLRKHLSVLLSKTFKSSVLIASNTFTESKTGVVTRVLNRNRQGDDDVENKEDVDIEDDIDIEDDVEVQDAKETKNTKNAKKMQATKEMQGTKVTKDTKEQRVQRESKTNQKRNRVRTMSHYNDLGLKKPLIVNFKEHVLSWEMLECLYPRYLPVDDDITELERECWIDLRPYMNEAPSIIHEHSVVTQAYQMFRHLGLRHLTVIDDNYDVVGMVTRHELVPSKIIQVANDFATLDEDWQNWSPTPKYRLRRFMSAGT
jgi:chloride channel 6